MKQSFQLNIENPCHEQWESFKPTTSGGFCGSCQKNVIDFSKMSENELVAFFRDRIESSHNLCGRFREDQLKKNYNIEEWFPTWNVQNNELQYEIPVAVIAQKKYKQAIRLPLVQHMKVVRNMAAAVLTLLCVEQGVGQDRVVSGKVVANYSNQAIPGVIITIKGSTTGTASDKNGNYTITATENDTLIFSALGFDETKKKVSDMKDAEKTDLQPDATQLGEVLIVITPYVRRKISGTTVSINTRDGFKDKRKHPTQIVILENTRKNRKVLRFAKRTTPKGIINISQKHPDDEKWFEENGFQDIASVQIYDYSGKVYSNRFKKLGNGKIKIDVKDIPKGDYVIRAVHKNEKNIDDYEVLAIRLSIK